MITKIEVEKVSNGYIITVNGNDRAIAGNSQDIKEYFGELLATNFQSIKNGETAMLEINAKINCKYDLPT